MALSESQEWEYIDIGEETWKVTRTPQLLQQLRQHRQHEQHQQHQQHQQHHEQYRNKQKELIGEDCIFTWVLEGPGVLFVFGGTQHYSMSAGKDSRHDMEKRIQQVLSTTWNNTRHYRRIVRMETEDHTSVAAEMPRAMWHLFIDEMKEIGTAVQHACDLR
jgi:hypothetical protein